MCMFQRACIKRSQKLHHFMVRAEDFLEKKSPNYTLFFTIYQIQFSHKKSERLVIENTMNSHWENKTQLTTEKNKHKQNSQL